MDISDYRQQILPLSSKLLRFAESLLDYREDARDTVQDVLLKLWEKRDELEKVKNRQAYAMQMVRNRCLDKVRESNRMVTLHGSAGIRLNDPIDDNRDGVEWKDTGNLVRRLIGKLPEQQKSIIFLRDVENREYDEIAEITGMNVNAVRVNLSRARKQVRDELLKVWQNEDRRSEGITAKVF